MVEHHTVLVVEDDAKSLKLACALLDLRGFHTVSARSATDAVRIARELLPQLVLMDIQLPGGDGTLALTQLKQDPRTADIPVVALTAFAMRGDRERFLADGFAGYVSKPIDAHSFVDVVSAFISPAT
jgi:two-component system, cell cycle response regulator DivK